MKKADWVGIIFSSLYVSATLMFPLFGMTNEAVLGHKVSAWVLCLVFTFMIGIFFNVCSEQNRELKNEIDELKREIESIKNNGKQG